MPLPEKELIARIRRRVSPGAQVLAGIGDDCAILKPPAGNEILVTTDFSLEGTHFNRQWHTAESVGHRCLARGLSDIAAMGGDAMACFLSLAVPSNLADKWVKEFLNGMLALTERFGVTLAGGDTAESKRGVLADIVVVGSAPAGQAVKRSGARPGDRIFVSGELGGSVAGLEALRRDGKRGVGKQWAKRYARHFFPLPRLELGRMLREKYGATAMIDTSDGLSTDLAHLCEESGAGAELWEEAIPRAAVGRPTEVVPLEWALHGGEDYELLFTAPQFVPATVAGVQVTPIGRITDTGKVMLLDREQAARDLHAQGWEHFGKRRR